MHLVVERISDETFAVASEATVVFLTNVYTQIFHPASEIQVENISCMDYAAPSTFNSM